MSNSKTDSSAIFRVAVPAPLYRLFDYLPPEGIDPHSIKPGARLRAPFGRGKKIVFLVEVCASSEHDPHRLKRIEKVLDDEPLLSETDLQLLHWASRYYHHPLGEVIATAFPVLLRQGRPAVIAQSEAFCLTENGRQTPLESLLRAPKQRALLEYFQAQIADLDSTQLQQFSTHWRPTLQGLQNKNLVELVHRFPTQTATEALAARPLQANPQQQTAIDAVTAALGRFEVFLLEGVTGSGKTEVYMQIIQAVLARGLQVLVLLPEISLTPQLEARFRARFAASVAIFHSGLNETQRQNAWLGMQQGRCSILLGTRSALFSPLRKPGLIVLDEEHDASFKQQEGFRFSARDLAIIRGRYLHVPVLLGSATPSLESLHNAGRQRYRHLQLPQRAGGAAAPTLQILDIRNRKLYQGLSEALLTEIEATLLAGEQVLVFLNRRGYAPTLICHACGWVARCRSCDANMVVHRRDKRLRCHHCSLEERLHDICPACGGAQLAPLGLGTERVETALAEKFPEYPLARLDRDTTGRKGALESMLAAIENNSVRIVLGTQMLAKGHHFPNVTLAAIVDADSGLFSIDFRATERLAQLITQVAGRAGREGKPGRVLLQTRQPQHPLLLTLLREGYAGFAQALLAERFQAGLPPFSHQAMLRSSAIDPNAPLQFLRQLRARITARGATEVLILGPVPAPMPRRAGQYRFQLLLQSATRQDLHDLLEWLTEQLTTLPQAKKVRWSVDVDPLDLF